MPDLHEAQNLPPFPKPRNAAIAEGTARSRASAVRRSRSADKHIPKFGCCLHDRISLAGRQAILRKWAWPTARRREDLFLSCRYLDPCPDMVGCGANGPEHEPRHSRCAWRSLDILVREIQDRPARCAR